MNCAIENCEKRAAAQIALINGTEVIRNFFCDSHGNQYVKQAMRERPIEISACQDLAGTRCCELCLIMDLPYENRHYLHLEEKGSRRWLGLYTGCVDTAVALETVSTPSPPRPFTHDSFNNVIQALGGKVKHALIHTSIRDETLSDQPIYLADIVIECPTGEVSVDMRPSDAISLCIRTDTPIFVSEQLLQEG